MENYHAKLIPHQTYHVYNRAIGDELLFQSDENYRFFLKQYRKYIFSVADTFAYCLMPNHFHFLLRVKGDEQLLLSFIAKAVGRKLTKLGFKNLSEMEQEDLLSLFVSNQFSHLFNSYSQAYNKQQSRKGSLLIEK
jgi:putative transposase